MVSHRILQWLNGLGTFGKPELLFAIMSQPTLTPAQPSVLAVILPDGSRKEFDQPVTAYDVAASIGKGLAKAAILAEVDGQQVDLHSPLPTSGEVRLRLLTKKDAEALAVMRHSCAHVMAQAVMRLFEGVQLAFGPTTGNGFYYDFQLAASAFGRRLPADRSRDAEDREGRRAVRAARYAARRSDRICAASSKQDFKVEHIETGLGRRAASLSFYRQGEFIDLCRGKHIPSTGHIGGAFKLLSVAGAYWKGDADREQLQRLYATAFFDKAELDAHLEQLAEAKRRDHRVLGKQLELFTVSQTVGSGLILWLPKGAIIRQTLEDYIKGELRKRGYEAVYTPNIGRVELYRNLRPFPVLQRQPVPAHRNERRRAVSAQADELPAPHHDLPGEAAELSRSAGAAGGIRHRLSLRAIGRTLGHDPRPRLHPGRRPYFLHRRASRRRVPQLPGNDPNRAGRAGHERVPRAARLPRSEERQIRRRRREVWDRAEAALKAVCESMNLPDMSIEPGEAAFYGPKADFVVTDCIGREWQLGTVQLDYNLPSKERFGLEYIGADNQPHQPVMIHRAPLGSLERFVGVLIEHFAGAFPLWLAPEQVRVLTVSEKSDAYGREVEKLLAEAGLRVTGDYRGAKLNAKVRDAQVQLIPYMFVVGERDRDARTRRRPRSAGGRSRVRFPWMPRSPSSATKSRPKPSGRSPPAKRSPRPTAKARTSTENTTEFDHGFHG